MKKILSRKGQFSDVLNAIVILVIVLSVMAAMIILLKKTAFF
ncbi:MAG: hypothetical protein R6U26_01880 [Candidatus Undinarchaeales archaeon]